MILKYREILNITTVHTTQSTRRVPEVILKYREILNITTVHTTVPEGRGDT